MDSEAGIQTVIDALNKNVDLSEWKIVEISWMEAEKLENEILLVAVTIVNARNDVYSQSYLLSGAGKGTATELRVSNILSSMRRINFSEIKGLNPADMDAKTIVSQIEEAKTMIPEGYLFKSVNRYAIEEVLPYKSDYLNEKQNVGAHEAIFDLNVVEKGKEKITSAGKTSLVYYELKFRVAPDGSVESRE